MIAEQSYSFYRYQFNPTGWKITFDETRVKLSTAFRFK